MQSRMWSRLKRLEAQRRLRPPVLRWGVLKRLPEEYAGERHVVIVESELSSSSRTGQCEFEERPGPPPPDLDLGCVLYLMPSDLEL